MVSSSFLRYEKEVDSHTTKLNEMQLMHLTHQYIEKVYRAVHSWYVNQRQSEDYASGTLYILVHASGSSLFVFKCHDPAQHLNIINLFYYSQLTLVSTYSTRHPPDPSCILAMCCRILSAHTSSRVMPYTIESQALQVQLIKICDSASAFSHLMCDGQHESHGHSF